MIRDRIDLAAASDRPAEPIADAAGRVTVEDVSVSFEDVTVLETASFEVEPGEFVGLVGPNGAGKTTCLRAISGAIEPDAGSVSIGDVDVQACSSRESSRLVAVVPQETHLSFSFPVRDVVEMGRHPHRSRFSPPSESDRELVDRALEQTRTTRFAERPIDEVSGGERQRVLLARAVAQDAPVLLLDEPTASLDVNHQIETLELVSDLAADGTTVVAAIHDLTLAARYCDRLLLLDEGAIQRAGAPEAVLSDPALAAAFDATLAVTENPVTGTPSVTALPPVDCELPRRVHVLGAGAVGAGVVARLSAAGVETSVGPVPEGDTTADLALEKATERVVVPPLQPLSDADVSVAAKLVTEADVIVVAAPHPEAFDAVASRLDRSGPVVVVEADERPRATAARRRGNTTAPADARYERFREQAVGTDRESVVTVVARAFAESNETNSVDWTGLSPQPAGEDD